MNNSIKLTGLASLLLLLGSCKSDDDVANPESKKQYLISQIHSTNYESTKIVNGNNVHTENTPTSFIDYSLSYDNKDQLASLTSYSSVIADGESTVSFNHVYDFKFNLSNQLDSLNVLLDNRKIQSDYFKYEGNLIQEFSILGNLKITLDYNKQNQFTTGVANFINPVTNGKPYTIKYNYNTSNQLVNYSYADFKINLTYATGKNPFDHLPFDLTTMTVGEFIYIPLTYRFSNPVDHYTVSNGTSTTTYTIQYSYNSANFPTKATVYKGAITPDKIVRVIEYTYITKDL